MAPPNRRQWQHKGRTSTNPALNLYARSRSALYRADMAMENPCPSHLFHLHQRPWNFPPPPDTFSGMHKIIEIVLAIVWEAFLSRAA